MGNFSRKCLTGIIIAVRVDDRRYGDDPAHDRIRRRVEREFCTEGAMCTMSPKRTGHLRRVATPHDGTGRA
jgi:hypothetical protein